MAAISDTPRGHTVVVSGAAGSGKSALLEVACRHARAVGFRVLSIAGTPGESDTSFAGVHQLIHALGHWGGEAEQYQHVIDDALRSPSGEQLDTVRVAMALLGLLDAVEKRQSVLVCIDDGQWLDVPSRNAMMFAARRSAGRSLTVVLAIPATAGKLLSSDGRAVEIELPPLERADAAVLLARQSSVPRGLRREQVLTAAAGNPAALIAFADQAAADDLTVGPAAEPLALPAPSLGIYSRRLALLPGTTRAALLLLATASDQDLRHLMPAVLADAETLAPAEVAGIVRVEPNGVRFLDPLMRSAAYHRAPSAARSAAHLRLADALVALPHRQVWHRAQAALKPDDALAAQLADTCDEVLRRDGYLAAATVMQRAATLTSDVGERARRLVRAAPLARNAGDPHWAAAMSRCALNGVDDLAHQVRAHAELGSARCWDANNQPVLNILLEAAGLAVDIAPAVAWESLRVAATVTFVADDAAGRCGVARLLRQLEDAERPIGVPALVDRIWIRTATQLHLAHLELPDIVRLAGQVDDPVGLTAIGASAWLAGEPDLAVRCLRGAHTGALAPRFGGLASTALSWAFVDSGRWDDAVETATAMSCSAAVADVLVVARIADLVIATVAARRGQTATSRERLKSAAESADFLDRPLLAAWLHHVAGSIALAENQNTTAYAELAPLFGESGLPLHAYASYLALPDYAEAAVLTGRINQAREQLTRIVSHLPRSVSPRLTQLVAHADAVLNPDTAGARYVEALADPAGNRWPFERARLRISYAGWLRRHRRRRDCQYQLAAALTVMQDLGAAPWVDLCTRELRAAGVRPPSSSVQTGALSSQEHNVVYLVSEGYTNPQIATILNLSVRTVSNHLYRSFPKLGVTSRHQIHDVARPATWTIDLAAPNS